MIGVEAGRRDTPGEVQFLKETTPVWTTNTSKIYNIAIEDYNKITL